MNRCALGCALGTLLGAALAVLGAVLIRAYASELGWQERGWGLERTRS